MSPLLAGAGIGLLTGALALVLFRFVLKPATLADAASFTRIYRGNRRSTFFVGLVGGGLYGLALPGDLASASHNLAALAPSVAAGLVSGVAVSAFLNSWGAFATARLWMAGTGRLPCDCSGSCTRPTSGAS